MKLIYTAIFGPYEELKEPTIITPGWKYVCVTDQPLKSDVWKILKVPTWQNRILQARASKLLLEELVLIYGLKTYSPTIWIDGSFTINCNLDEWWDKHFKGEMTCIKHPIRDCIYEEGEVCVRYGKDNGLIEEQLWKYQESDPKVPKRNGLIQSGILMRTPTVRVKKLCKNWFEEITLYSLRDQISFGRVSIGKSFIHYIKWDYRIEKEFIYKTHFKNRK